MKVLVFIDWFAPAYKAGGPIQSIINLVNQPLEGLEYKIICSNRDLDKHQLTSVPFDKWVRFNKQTEVWYNSNNKKIIEILKLSLRWSPDIFFINGIYSFYYNFLPLIYGGGIKKIVSVRGMLHSGALSQKRFKKRAYIVIWKFLGLHHTSTFHATTPEEKNFVQTAFDEKTKVFVAQNFPR
ncbi:MAG: hypothetical protein M3Y85_00115, partial [Bacteroidota bacterium]|nr:hypothetical protein [Bacteroidota bacterium]